MKLVRRFKLRTAFLLVGGISVLCLVLLVLPRQRIVCQYMPVKTNLIQFATVSPDELETRVYYFRVKMTDDEYDAFISNFGDRIHYVASKGMPISDKEKYPEWWPASLLRSGDTYQWMDQTNDFWIGIKRLDGYVYVVERDWSPPRQWFWD